MIAGIDQRHKSLTKRALQESLDQLINQFFNLISPDSILHDDMVIIAGRHKQLERDSIRGTVDQDTKEKSLAQIRSGLLKVINDLKEEDLLPINSAEDDNPEAAKRGVSRVVSKLPGILKNGSRRILGNSIIHFWRKDFGPGR
ncbi:MAG: hypothetical protein IPG32_12900 [Saprospirales bacterium]|nr:hypothetical protein [Saprospirales bacterium]